jgi:ABC-type ATPase involved in cell division
MTISVALFAWRELHTMFRLPPDTNFMTHLISVRDLIKRYDDGFTALNSVSLDIEDGEIIALLGPNGAGKTTLISIICGIVSPSSGSVRVAGHDIIEDFRKTRAMIGLVPQELTTDAFESVWNTVSFSRGLFGQKRDDAHVEKVLRDLSLWDKKDSKIMQLSGGMKRRVLIAKALAHEPRILFRQPGSMSNCARICGMSCARCAKTALPSFSLPTISRKPRRSQTASPLSVRARSPWWRKPTR